MDPWVRVVEVLWSLPRRGDTPPLPFTFPDVMTAIEWPVRLPRGARRCSVFWRGYHVPGLISPITLSEGCLRLIEDTLFGSGVGRSASGPDFGIHDRRDPQCY